MSYYSAFYDLQWKAIKHQLRNKTRRGRKRKSMILTWYCLAQNRACRHLSTASSVSGPGRWMRSSKAVEVAAGPDEAAVPFGRHRCWPWLLFAFFTSAMMLEIGGERRQPSAVTHETIPSSEILLCRFGGSKSITQTGNTHDRWLPSNWKSIGKFLGETCLNCEKYSTTQRRNKYNFKIINFIG